MRVTVEQFNRRKENRVTGAYEVSEPRTFRRRQQSPRCENCGRETEVLFDGFIARKAARAKFILGEEIKLSAEGRGRWRFRKKRVFLFAFCTDDEMIRIKPEGNQQSEYYHMDFWEPVKWRDEATIRALAAPFLSERGMVCQRCRPLSDLEQKEKIRQILRDHASA